MAYRVYHRNKTNGTTYVYEAISYWDKEKKRPANKQICIGKLDKDTNKFIPSKRLNNNQNVTTDPQVTANVQIIGSTLILDKITEELGIDKILKSSSRDTYQQLLTMVYFLVAKGNALSHCESWCKGHRNPLLSPLPSQRISEILKLQSEDERQSFFKVWSKKICENDYLCYDITSVSSYSEQNEYIKYGYNRDGEKLPQINIGMLFGQKSKLPICYKRMPGSITDVSTLKKFIHTLNYLNLSRIHMIMDRGFYSNSNIDELFNNKNKFIMGCPTNLKWIRNIIDEYHDDIEMPDNHRKINGETLYVKTKLFSWGKKKKRLYTHIYYNSYVAASAFDKFTEQLISWKEELENGDDIEKHNDYYQRYFIIKETQKRGRSVQFNNEAIQKQRNRYAGFFVIISNSVKDAREALQIYRNKDVVENCFDDLKNQLDMKRLRVQNSQTMDGRLFVQFIALIYISALREKISNNKNLINYTYRELLEEMETLSMIKYSGRYGSIISEMTKKQRIILEAFSIEA